MIGYANAGALRDAIRAFRYGEDPEVVEYEESGETTTQTAQRPASGRDRRFPAPIDSRGQRHRARRSPRPSGPTAAPAPDRCLLRRAFFGPLQHVAVQAPGFEAARPRPGRIQRPDFHLLNPPPKSTNPILIVGVLGGPRAPGLHRLRNPDPAGRKQRGPVQHRQTDRESGGNATGSGPTRSRRQGLQGRDRADQAHPHARTQQPRGPGNPRASGKRHPGNREFGGGGPGRGGARRLRAKPRPRSNGSWRGIPRTRWSPNYRAS